MDTLIFQALEEYAYTEQRCKLMKFFKTSKGQYGYGDEFLGVKVPQTREVVGRFWQKCEWQDIEALVTSKYHEMRLAGLLVLVRKYKWAMKHAPGMQDEIISFYLKHTQYVNNWDLVDLSCYELLGYWVLEQDERKDVLCRLVHSENMWEQRIAIVSTMQLIRHGKLDMTFELADELLFHKHDLIHKAVGWLLREAGKRDAARLEKFLKPRYKQMPRTMLRYAIEKFPEERRKQYLAGTIE